MAGRFIADSGNGRKRGEGAGGIGFSTTTTLDVGDRFQGTPSK